jgi:polysaccharide biosynthesis transport protein
MDGTQGTQLDLRAALRALWRRRWVFLGVLVSIPVAVLVISLLVPKTYEAESLIRTQGSTLEAPGLTDDTLTAIGEEALLVNTEKIREAAAEELGGSSSQASSLSIRAAPVTTSGGQDTDLLRLTAQAETASRAAAVANAYATAVDRVRTGERVDEIDRTIAGLRAQSDLDADGGGSTAATTPDTQLDIASQLQVLRAGRAAAQQSTETVQDATPPSEPVSPKPARNTALAAVVSLLLALGSVVVMERLDRRVRNSDELEPLLDEPLLSVIPQAAFPGERPTPGAVREAFRTLAASLVYFNVDRPLSTVMISSPTKGDGKTTVAVHLAAALAQDGQDVALVDADMRHPQVAVRLGIDPPVGLSDVITRQSELRDALVEVDAGDGRLRVLAAGSQPPNPSRLLSSQRMSTLLVTLSDEVDIVIVDTPPLLNVSDAVPLLESVSGTVLVARVGATTRDALERVRQVIDKARGSVLGAVATGAAGVGLYGYGDAYYQDGYGDAYDQEGDAGREVTPTAFDAGAAARASRENSEPDGREQDVGTMPRRR